MEDDKTDIRFGVILCSGPENIEPLDKTFETDEEAENYARSQLKIDPNYVSAFVVKVKLTEPMTPLESFLSMRVIRTEAT